MTYAPKHARSAALVWLAFCAAFLGANGLPPGASTTARQVVGLALAAGIPLFVAGAIFRPTETMLVGTAAWHSWLATAARPAALAALVLVAALALQWTGSRHRRWWLAFAWLPPLVVGVLMRQANWAPRFVAWTAVIGGLVVLFELIGAAASRARLAKADEWHFSQRLDATDPPPTPSGLEVEPDLAWQFAVAWQFGPAWLTTLANIWAVRDGRIAVRSHGLGYQLVSAFGDALLVTQLGSWSQIDGGRRLTQYVTSSDPSDGLEAHAAALSVIARRGIEPDQLVNGRLTEVIRATTPPIGPDDPSPGLIDLVSCRLQPGLMWNRRTITNNDSRLTSWLRHASPPDVTSS